MPKKEDKMPYVYNHIRSMREKADTIKEHLKWIYDDIKFIEKISKPQEEPQKTKTD